MGNLSYFNLQEYIEKYNSEFLIETGTFKGTAIEYALKFGFKKIFSIELLKKYYDYCSEKFKNNDNIVLLNGTSPESLMEILIHNDIGNTIFWLDAHLPNHHDKTISNDYVENKDLLIPLEEELKSIINNKDISRDVFIIDDLRIYEKGGFVKGEWYDVINSGIGGIDFIFNLLSNTHDIQRIYDGEGYVLCTPKINLI